MEKKNDIKNKATDDKKFNRRIKIAELILNIIVGIIITSIMLIGIYFLINVYDLKEIFNKPYNVLFVASIIVILGIGLIISLKSKQCIDKRCKGFEEDIILQKAYFKRNLWLTASIFWMTLKYIFLILPFEATVIVIYLNVSNVDTEGILIYSVISLALLVFSYEINPNNHMRSYRKAYVRVDKALNIYIDTIANNNHEAKQDLIQAIDNGECNINNSYDID